MAGAPHPAAAARCSGFEVGGTPRAAGPPSTPACPSVAGRCNPAACRGLGCREGRFGWVAAITAHQSRASNSWLLWARRQAGQRCSGRSPRAEPGNRPLQVEQTTKPGDAGAASSCPPAQARHMVAPSTMISPVAKLPLLEQPVDDEELLKGTEALAPRVLGQLLGATVLAIRNFAKTKLAERVRMVGPARWIEAAAPALGLRPGEFLEAYLESASHAHEIALEASVIGGPLRGMLDHRDGLALLAAKGRRAYGGPLGFKGTAEKLLKELNEHTAAAPRPRGWPQSPKGLGGQLRRIAPALRKLGYRVDFGFTSDQAHERLITIDTELSYAQHSASTGIDRPNRPNRPTVLLGMLLTVRTVRSRGGALGRLGFTKHKGLWAQLVGFEFACLRPRPPYFLLGLFEEQGRGKTTAEISRLRGLFPSLKVLNMASAGVARRSGRPSEPAAAPSGRSPGMVSPSPAAWAAGPGCRRLRSA